MISVINVPPVLDSQVYSPTVATQVVAVQSITAQPVLSARFSKLQPSLNLSGETSPKGRTNPKLLVKSISLWSAGASRDLKLDMPLLTVLKAENPRSTPAAAPAASQSASSVQAKIEDSGKDSSADSVAVKEKRSKIKVKLALKSHRFPLPKPTIGTV